MKPDYAKWAQLERGTVLQLRNLVEQFPDIANAMAPAIERHAAAAELFEEAAREELAR